MSCEGDHLASSTVEMAEAIKACIPQRAVVLLLSSANDRAGETFQRVYARRAKDCYLVLDNGTTDMKDCLPGELIMNSLAMSTTGAINRAKAISLDTRRAKMKSISFVSDKRIWRKLSKLVCQKSQDEIN